MDTLEAKLGDRSERSEQRPPGGDTGQDSEVPQVGKKRRFTSAYRLQILEEADRCKKGELGALLRREGLYHSMICKWRAWRDKMNDPDLKPDLPPQKKSLQAQLSKLEAENMRLKLKLKKAQGLLELQKKAFELLESLNQGLANDEKS
jgi:transposase